MAYSILGLLVILPEDFAVRPAPAGPGLGPGPGPGPGPEPGRGPGPAPVARAGLKESYCGRTINEPRVLHFLMREPLRLRPCAFSVML